MLKSQHKGWVQSIDLNNKVEHNVLIIWYKQQMQILGNQGNTQYVEASQCIHMVDDAKLMTRKTLTII